MAINDIENGDSNLGIRAKLNLLIGHVNTDEVVNLDVVTDLIADSFESVIAVTERVTTAEGEIVTLQSRATSLETNVGSLTSAHNALAADYTPFKTATQTALTTDATVTTRGMMSAADKSKLNAVEDGANNYTHPSGDGNLHVPATSTTNNGKFLKAGATAGSISWVTIAKADVGLGNVDNTSDANKPLSTAAATALAGKLSATSNLSDLTDAAIARTSLGLGTASQQSSNAFAPAAHVGSGGSAHAAATTSTAGFLSAADKTKLDGVATGATNYTHPTGDGSLHVPATGTANNGKFLKAGATAGSAAWVQPVKADVGLGNVDNTSDANKPVSTATATALNAKLTIASNLSDLLDKAAARFNLGLGSAATQADTDFAPSSHVGSGGTAHANATTSVAGFLSAADKTKLDGVATSANNYVHPTGDGNSHVPATSTTNNGKALVAGATANSAAWIQLTKSHVGLSNVDNTSDANKPISSATQTALDDKLDASHAGTGGTAHAAATTSVAGFISAADKTKLDGVATGANNYTHPSGDGNLHVPATSTTNNGRFLKAGATAGSISWVAVTKTDVGLSNVDNTADSAKPVSTAQQTALDGKLDTSHAGSGGTAHANANTTVAGFMSAADKIKLDGVATGATNYTHPSGDGNLHVPATSTTNNGKFLKAGATAGSISWSTLAKTDVGLSNVDNTSDANKPVSTAQQTALDLKTDELGTIVSDWNLASNGGFYNSDAAASNAPAATFLAGFVSQRAGQHAAQLAFDLSGTLGAFARTRYGSVWGSWKSLGDCIGTIDDTLRFGTSATRQMINLYTAAFGIGIQSSTQYNRAMSGGNFAWFEGGVHSNTAFDPGAGGQILLGLNASIFQYKGNDIYHAGSPAGAILPSKMAGAAVGKSLVTNPTFEYDGDGWVLGSGSSIVTDADNTSGAKCLSATKNSNLAYTSETLIPVTAGDTYYAGVFAKGNVASAAGLYVRIYWYKNTGAASATAYSDVASNVAFTASWAKYGGRITAPSDASYAKCSALHYTTSTATTLRFDDIMFSQVIDSENLAANIVLTGVPAAPTAAAGSSTTQLATTAFVSTALGNTAQLNTNNNFVAQTLSVRQNGSSGYTLVSSGDAAAPGYVAFHTTDGVRRGFIGYKGTGNTVALQSENGWGWEVVGSTSFVNDATFAGNVTINNPGTLSFGSSTRQMLNLYGSTYGIGVQGSTLYQRTGGGFAFFLNGSHSGTQWDPGAGGTLLLAMSTSVFQYKGNDIWHAGNFDPNSKANVSHAHAATDITSGTLPDARLPARINTTCNTITDWNLAVQNGWFMGSNIPNQPVAGNMWWIGQVFVHNSQWITQEVWAFANGSNSDTMTYRRSMQSNTWGAWVRVWKTELELDARYAKLGASVTFADIVASRGDGTGVLYLNAANNRYLYFNGSNYEMPGGNLIVNGYQAWTAGTFDPATKANLASPALTGTPTAPTPSTADNTTKIATTAHVQANAALKANLASPALTGTPTAPTAAAATNNTQIATTAHVKTAIAATTAFTARPTFAGMIPWDEGNLNPSETILASVAIASAVAYIELTLPVGYNYFRVLYQGLSSDYSGPTNNYLVARFKKAGAFITTGSYAWAAIYSNGVAAPAVWGHTTFNNCIGLSSASLPNDSKQFNGSVMIDPGDSVNYPAIKNESTNGTIQHFGNGYLGTAGRIEALQLITITGNINRGRYWLYGVR